MIRKTSLVVLACLIAGRVFARGAGGISGTVKDSTGGVLPGATVTLTNTALGTQFTTLTDAQGFYVFPNVAVGVYDLTIQLQGFKPLKRTGLKVDAGSRHRVDASLEVGGQTEMVTVSANEIQVETVSTQLGEVVSSEKMTRLSLNGRSYTDLLSIQPGVAPTTTLKPNSIVMAGVTGAIAPSGDLSPGNVSINGQRESANGFIVNGGDVQEHMNGGTSIVPNLDSIAQFRVLTNNYDAQYGNYNGGIINVVTKSGSDQLRGNVFEFLRATALDSRGFFDPDKAAFKQSQPGGTLGGPLKKGTLFFFTDYQATRMRQGIETGLISVPSIAARGGNLAEMADTFTGNVNGRFWASLLTGRLGYLVSPGEPYYQPGCRTTSQCVFPDAVIPSNAWSEPARHLLQYIPAPNAGTGVFSASANNQTVRDDKGSLRLDANSRLGLLSGYYFLDDYRLDDPYPVQYGGASVPGFDALTLGRAQLFSLGGTKVLTPTLVNEFHVSYMRHTTNAGLPHGGAGVSVASQGFVTGPATPGIVVQAPRFEGVENVAFNSFVMGVTTTGVDQKNGTWHWSDNLSKVVGAHSIRMGGEFHYDRVDIDPNAQFNGTFSFTGTETGSDFADFLLGIPSGYIQAAGAPFHLRNKYAGAFAEDSWRARSTLTVNYGVRWDMIMPWYEKYNQIQTLVPGRQSVVYPGGPAGLVFPGDPGIPPTLSPTRYGNVSPRVGLAYSPGGDNKTSVRAGYGIFRAAFPGLSGGIMFSIPPFGENYLSPAPPLFDRPFITAADGTNNGQKFPKAPLPLDASAKKPNTHVDWSQLLPINGDPFFFHDNSVPYSEDYMLSVQRELPAHVLLTASYVGSKGHKLLVIQQANPGNPALCLSVSDPGQVAPGSPTCGPFAENGTFVTRSGMVINGTRPLGSDYGTVTAQKTIGRSKYDALEINLRYGRPGVGFLVGYTLGKSIDLGSNLSEQVNPSEPDRTWAPSSFDMRHNFVGSYDVDLAVDRLLGRRNMFTAGWTLSGTARFSSGYPVTLYNNRDTSLLGTFGNGVNNDLLDTPNFTPGPLNTNHDPRKGPAFNTSLFSLPALGQLGNAPRRFFYGPGIENLDLALIKTVGLPRAQSLELRVEAFNVLDRPQFYGPAAVDGNISSSTFGQIVRAAPPRLVQIAAKFTF